MAIFIVLRHKLAKPRINTIVAVCLLFAALAATADVVLDWNVIALDTFAANGQNAFATARFAAIVQVAVFEAVNAVTHDYEPYLGSIVAMPSSLA